MGLVGAVGHELAVDLAVLGVGVEVLVFPDGAPAAGEQADEGGLAGGGLGMKILKKK